MEVANINPYLVDANDIVLQRRTVPICNVPIMRSGNKPIDDGNYLFTPEEKLAFIKKEPQSFKWFRRWLGGEEFLNKIERWYLWLGDCPPQELKKMPEVMKRVEAVASFRRNSVSAPTRAIADMPTRFHVECIPKDNYLALPEVSSERRPYIPIAFLDEMVLCGNKLRIVEPATMYHFGVLHSVMHMAWVRYTTGRLKSDYQYSIVIVYNNFPWPDSPTDKQRAAIEEAAQGVLDARAAHPEASLADLYDPVAMPPDLRRAHQVLDKAVDAAYGKKNFSSDAERVAFLFELYQKYTSLLPAPGPQKKRKKIELPAAT